MVLCRHLCYSVASKKKGGSRMAKRISRPMDSARTDLLAIEELFVVKGKGDENNFVAWLNDENGKSVMKKEKKKRMHPCVIQRTCR